MKILIVGFQRSGTTLLRRILHSHPDICRMFHEEFLLKKYNSKTKLENYLINCDIYPNEDNWGEKVPFYPSVRGISMKKYCETWNEYFGETAKILHIIRHPIDVGFSIEKKYSGQKFAKGIDIYKKIMSIVVPNLLKTPNCFSFKYEDLLINPDKKVKEILNFCGLKQFDYKGKLSKIANEKYQKIDPTRAFAYRNKKRKPKVNLDAIISVLNKIPGTNYKGD